MAADELQVLDYASAKAVLDRLIGKRVSARIATTTGASVAQIDVGYLQAPSQFGEPPKDDEVTLYAITERAEPVREDNRPFSPDVRIHDVADFKAWTNGARVDCRFSGVTVTVELANPDDWRMAARTYEAGP
jgi:hypothetical protein